MLSLRHDDLAVLQMPRREFKIGQSLFYHPTNRLKATGRYVVLGRLFSPRW
jgi:hypothetical protein